MNVDCMMLSAAALALIVASIAFAAPEPFTPGPGQDVCKTSAC